MGYMSLSKMMASTIYPKTADGKPMRRRNDKELQVVAVCMKQEPYWLFFFELCRTHHCSAEYHQAFGKALGSIDRLDKICVEAAF